MIPIKIEITTSMFCFVNFTNVRGLETFRKWFRGDGGHIVLLILIENDR